MRSEAIGEKRAGEAGGAGGDDYFYIVSSLSPLYSYNYELRIIEIPLCPKQAETRPTFSPLGVNIQSNFAELFAERD